MENFFLFLTVLTPYFPRTKARKEKNLLSGETGVEEEAEEADVIVPHWHSVSSSLFSPAKLSFFGRT